MADTVSAAADRLARAVKDHDPEGYVRVRSADVIAVGAAIPDATHTEFSRMTHQGAANAVEGKPEGLALVQQVYQRARDVAHLLERFRVVAQS